MFITSEEEQYSNRNKIRNSDLQTLFFLNHLYLDVKWLIYDCKFNFGGWADRIKGNMSVYALSIMTRRQFLIDIELSCNFSQLFVPNEIDWSMKPNQIKDRKNFMHIPEDPVNSILTFYFFLGLPSGILCFLKILGSILTLLRPGH